MFVCLVDRLPDIVVTVEFRVVGVVILLVDEGKTSVLVVGVGDEFGDFSGPLYCKQSKQDQHTSPHQVNMPQSTS